MFKKDLDHVWLFKWSKSRKSKEYKFFVKGDHVATLYYQKGSCNNARVYPPNWNGAEYPSYLDLNTFEDKDLSMLKVLCLAKEMGWKIREISFKIKKNRLKEER